MIVRSNCLAVGECVYIQDTGVIKLARRACAQKKQPNLFLVKNIEDEDFWLDFEIYPRVERVEPIYAKTLECGDVIIARIWCKHNAHGWAYIQVERIFTDALGTNIVSSELKSYIFSPETVVWLT